MSRLNLVCRVLLVIVWAAAAARQAHALTADEVASDVALAREAYERVHPGYTRYASAEALNAAWDDIVTTARLENGLSTEQFYLRLQGVLAMIRCDHTKAELPAALSKARREGPYYLPLRFELFGDRALVREVGDGVAVTPGEELLSIDGQPLAALVERFAPLIPVDAYTDHVKSGELAWSLEFDGGAIEHFLALEGVAPTARIAVSNAAGDVRTLDVPRIGLVAQRALAKGRVANFRDAVSLDLRDDGAAILRVDTFVNYRDPVEPDEIYAPLFKRINEADVDHLIVDLRANGGGSNDARDRLLAHLITERTTIQQEVRVKTLNLDGLREHLQTWEPRALKPKRWWFKALPDGGYRVRGGLVSRLFGLSGDVKPARNAYRGRLTVLSSAGNSSGSTMLIAALQATGRARIVGGPTGGNAEGSTAGILFFLKLPASGIRARLPIQRMVTGYAATGASGGVKPDVGVVAMLEDRRAGRDRVLAVALGAGAPSAAPQR